MRILALSPSLPSPFEGGVLQLFYFLERLKRDYGHRITLLSLLEQPTRAGPSPDELRFCDAVQTVAVPRSGTRGRWLYGLRALFRPRHLFSKSHTFLNPGYSAAMHGRVQDALASGEFDVVLAHSLYTAFYVWDVRLPRVVHIDHPFVEGYRRWLRRTSILSLPMKLLALLMYYANVRETRRVYEKGFYALVTAGPQDVPIWRRYLPHMNIVPIPNGVDTEYFVPTADESEEPSLVFTGAMSSPANANAVLHFYRELFPLIRRMVPQVRLYVVGQEPPPHILALGKDPGVVVTGFVPDVRPYLGEAWVVVVPTTVGMGCPNKILEAMAMGKSVVTTWAQAGGFPVTPGVHVAIADTPEEFAGQAVALLQDKARRRAMGQAARALVEERYTWTATTERLQNLLEEAVRVGRAGV
ncbi:MAG: glycosyltransferase [Dehalococcoidia bacterium]